MGDNALFRFRIEADVASVLWHTTPSFVFVWAENIQQARAIAKAQIAQWLTPWQEDVDYAVLRNDKTTDSYYVGTFTIKELKGVIK